MKKTFLALTILAGVLVQGAEVITLTVPPTVTTSQDISATVHFAKDTDAEMVCVGILANIDQPEFDDWACWNADPNEVGDYITDTYVQDFYPRSTPGPYYVQAEVFYHEDSGRPPVRTDWAEVNVQ